MNIQAVEKLLLKHRKYWEFSATNSTALPFCASGLRWRDKVRSFSGVIIYNPSSSSGTAT